MSLPKKGSRKIVVAGQTFRWLCSKPQYQGPWREPNEGELDAKQLADAKRFGSGAVREIGLTILVECWDEPVSRLHGLFRGLIIDHYIEIEQQELQLSPKHTRALIEAGLKHGWNPGQRGDLTLRASEIPQDTLLLGSRYTDSNL